jgi:hypothetical protein
LPPEPVLIDGSIFDPVEHFRAVRATGDGHGSLEERRAALASRMIDLVAELRANGNPTNQVIADFLNQQGVTTITGKTWTSENVKQFLKSAY